MSAFTDEALKELQKDDLIVTFQDQQHEGHKYIENMEETTNGVKKLSENFQKSDAWKNHGDYKVNSAKSIKRNCEQVF